MKFLAIDTSGKYLNVAAYADGRTEKRSVKDCALRHSVVLMDEIGAVLSRAGLRLADCDFLAAVVGPGSFTGIRIGISTVKGLCFSCDRPALAVTSFDAAAYIGREQTVLVHRDAGRGDRYACGYRGKQVVLPPFLVPESGLNEYEARGFALLPAESLDAEALADGLVLAAADKAEERAGAEKLRALYLRRSSAEENRK